MPSDKTHSVRPKPWISARYLADFMAATEPARRTIVRDSKFQPRARLIQHDEAKAIVAKFIRDETDDIVWLGEEAQSLRERIADSGFDRELYDHNADYIARFAKVWPLVQLPKARIQAPGAAPPIRINGVTVSVELQLRLTRTTRTNKIRTGGIVFRYAKGKALPAAVGDWQSAFLIGYLLANSVDQNAEPERTLCLTFDVYTGTFYPAPSDSIRRYNQMKAACATIAERWPNIQPPPNAIL